MTHLSSHENKLADTHACMQLQHDYLLGNYPVGRDDAAQLCALQILVGIGFVNSPESCM